jgi:hypothetical protein
MNGLCFPWNTFMQIDDWVAPDLQTYDYNPSKASFTVAVPWST